MDEQKGLRQALRKLPAPLLAPLRLGYSILKYILPGSIIRRRWLKNSYTAHNRGMRRDLFLSIANFAHINRPISGYYFEFGCHGAHTMRLAWDNFRHLFDWQFVAFDSFQGLPKIQDIDRQEIWEKGKLRTAEDEFRRLCRRYGIPNERLITIPGFYSETLNEETARRFTEKAAVVYVDCDLYESTVPVLRFCRSFLQRGTIIVFDDWNCFWADPDRGERRAWREFLEQYPELSFERFCENGLQAAFVCTRP